MKNIIKIRDLISVLVLTIVIIVINIQPLVVNAAIYNVSSKVESLRVAYEIEDYKEVQTNNFIIRYKDINDDMLNLIKDYSEESYSRLNKYFKYVPKEKITIIVFPDIKSMNNVLHLPSNQRSMGLYYCGFISILSPNAWISDKDINNVKETFKKSGPIVHELTHYFVDKKTDANYPIWFTEGVALYFENILTGFEWGQTKEYSSTSYTIEQLTNNFEELNQDVAYRESYEKIRDYVENNSMQDLLNIMKRLREGYSLEEFRK